ncbi:uncharacterized protein C5orf47 homolog [Ochotona curzoniae]|uniref:uncharacterized protein C5orf47 homolog n=1 Tax=Ochotona curzoniae TaxID=130825 RepID=UPI001B34DB1A|nr:uncharacterized protein C5orf47 homolog [Ochotona curzoniae]
MAAKDQGQDQGQDQEQVQGQARFVYISRFGSYRCGGVWQLGGPKAQRRCPPALAAQSREQEQLRPEAAPGQAAKACATARWQALRVRSPGRQTARARGSAGGEAAGRAGQGTEGFNRKGAGEEFDFPIPLDGAAKITKKKKKVSVWNSVHKVISKLLKENERYRLRLKCQKASSDSK